MNRKIQEQNQFVESHSSDQINLNPSFDSSFSSSTHSKPNLFNFDSSSSSSSSYFESQSFDSNSNVPQNLISSSSVNDSNSIKKIVKTVKKTSHRRNGNGSSSQDHYSSGKLSLSKELGFEEFKIDNESNQSHNSNSKNSHKRNLSNQRNPINHYEKQPALIPIPSAPKIKPIELELSISQISDRSFHVNERENGLRENSKSLEQSLRPKLKHKRALDSLSIPQNLEKKERAFLKGTSQTKTELTKRLKDEGSYDLFPFTTKTSQSQNHPLSNSLEGCKSSENSEKTALIDSKFRSINSNGKLKAKEICSYENKENNLFLSLDLKSNRQKEQKSRQLLHNNLPSSSSSVPTCSTPPPPSISKENQNQKDSDSIIENSFPSSFLQDQDFEIQNKFTEFSEDHNKKDLLLIIPARNVDLYKYKNNLSTETLGNQFTFPSRSGIQSHNGFKDAKKLDFREEKSKLNKSDCYDDERKQIDLSDGRVGVLKDLGIQEESKVSSVEMEKKENKFWNSKKIKGKEKEKNFNENETENSDLKSEYKARNESNKDDRKRNNSVKSSGTGTRQRLLSLFKSQKLFGNNKSPIKSKSPLKKEKKRMISTLRKNENEILSQIVFPSIKNLDSKTQSQSQPRSRYQNRKVFKASSPNRAPPRRSNITNRRNNFQNSPAKSDFRRRNSNINLLLLSSPSISQMRNQTLNQLSNGIRNPNPNSNHDFSFLNSTIPNQNYNSSFLNSPIPNSNPNNSVTKLNSPLPTSNPYFLSPKPPTPIPRFQSYSNLRKEQLIRTKNEERLKALSFLNGDLNARIKSRKKGEVWKEVGGKKNLIKNFERGNQLQERNENEKEKNKQDREMTLVKGEIPKWKSGMFKEEEESEKDSNDIDFNNSTKSSFNFNSKSKKDFNQVENEVFLQNSEISINDKNLSLSIPSTPKNQERNSSTPSSIGRPPVAFDVSAGINHLIRSNERAREIARSNFVDLKSPPHMKP